jgi:hypothetical protein
MAAFNKSNAFVEDVCEKIHNLGADSLKIMLTNVAPVAGNSVKADLTEIAAGNGSENRSSFAPPLGNTATVFSDRRESFADVR